MPRGENGKTQPRINGRFAKASPSESWWDQPAFPDDDPFTTFERVVAEPKVVVRTLTRDRIPMRYLIAWITISAALCIASGLVASRYPII